MKKYLLPALSALLLVAGCTSESEFRGYSLVTPDSAIVTGHNSFNGYTNHWQNEFNEWYRYGNLFKINNCDVEKAVRANMADLAADLGLPGLRMQEGFLNGIILAGNCAELFNPDADRLKNAIADTANVIVYALRESETGEALASKAPVPEKIGMYQENAKKADFLDAFVLRKGKHTIYAAVGSAEELSVLKNAVDNAREVLSLYDMKRGWFGVQTHCKSVTCTHGNQLEVIGRGMNEGNSWFVFSGIYEFESQGETQEYVKAVGDPVVVDHGYNPLYGADYSSLQVQLMDGSDDWKAFQKEHGGYFLGHLPQGADSSNPGCDLFLAEKGIIKGINRCDKPFVTITGELLGGTCNCMVLFNDKGTEFNRDKMWEDILSRKAVAVMGGNALAGPDRFRKTIDLLMLDRTYIEDYFADKVNMVARMEGHTLKLDVTNFHTYNVEGEVSLILPETIKAGTPSSSRLSLRPGQSATVELEVDPSPEAMDKLNAVIARFDWGASSKCALASFNLPPAVSAHQLLYGTEAECKFPVAIHNITHDNVVNVTLSVTDSEGKVVCEQEKEYEVGKGSYLCGDFDLKLPAGSYTVKTSAMGADAYTQLGIGPDTGDVSLYEVDLNGDGVNEYVMENDKVKVTLLTTGARIIEYCVKGVDDNIFFKLWPDQPCDVNRPNREWGFWPYGGFEDFLGQASVETHKVYDAEITRNDGHVAEVTMTADYYGNGLKKTYTLYGDTPMIGIRYALDFINPEMNVIGPQPILVLGKSHGTEDKFIMPEGKEGLSTYVMDPKRMYGRLIDLREGWNAGYDTVEKVHFVGAYPVNRPYYLHMWMNLDTNGESHYPYTELQPWVPIQMGTTSFFSYYMWAGAGSWENGLEALRERNLITVR